MASCGRAGHRRAANLGAPSHAHRNAAAPARASHVAPPSRSPTPCMALPLPELPEEVQHRLGRHEAREALRVATRGQELLASSGTAMRAAGAPSRPAPPPEPGESLHGVAKHGGAQPPVHQAVEPARVDPDRERPALGRDRHGAQGSQAPQCQQEWADGPSSGHDWRSRGGEHPQPLGHLDPHGPAAGRPMLGHAVQGSVARGLVPQRGLPVVHPLRSGSRAAAPSVVLPCLRLGRADRPTGRLDEGYGAR